ncbi:MAG TPA: hypothetical protein ACQGQW_09760, partial [Xylella fastidiosa subsp. pauca]
MRLSTGSFRVRAFPKLRGMSSYAPFWVEPVSVFGSFILTVFISTSHTLTIPTSLAIHPRWRSQ